MRERVLLLGLDGGEPSRLEPALGRLPNLARFVREGAWGRLRSTVPPLSPPAWATLMTGVNPGKHGVFDFYHMARRAQGSYVRRLITSAHWRAPALWDRLTRRGRRAGFVNMPMCWPPPRLGGFFVCGLGAPPGGTRFTEPELLGASLGDAILEPGDGTTFGDPRAFLARCRASGASMLAVAEQLWRSADLDLFCAALTFPDRLQHLFWRELEAEEPAVTSAEREWLAAFDAFLGRVLAAAAADGTTVVCFSDHGFGPVDRYFHVNRWLLQRGWLHVGDATRLGTPDGLLTAIDWSRTRAFALGEYGEIRLNVRGREPLGIVEPGAEATALRDELVAALRALRDDEGRCVADDVRVREAVYHGALVDEGPDVVFGLRGYRDLCRIDGRGTDLREPAGPLFVPADRPEHYRGAHRRDGLFAAWGTAVQPGTSPTLDACDLTPTVLHLLGLPLDSSLDGRVAAEVLAEPLRSRPIVYEGGAGAAGGGPAGAYSPEEEAQITEQLRQLGYVE